MVDFYPVRTEDGTLSLFNTKINDIYHSKIGAFTEALKKFVIPSGILEYAQHKDNISILDVCYGLGYNSRVAVSEIWKVNPKCKIHVTGIEIDPNVLAASFFATYTNDYNRSIKYFRRALLSNRTVRASILKFNKDVKFTPENDHKNKPIFSRFKKPGHLYYVKNDFNSILHNIYYGSVSTRNNSCQYIRYTNTLIDIELHIKDLRLKAKELDNRYNFIFHDPFTPSLLPSLWSTEIFKELYRLLDDNGNITTYTSSAAVRSGMIEAGLFIGKSIPVGRKSTGTIAYKKKELIINKLSDQESGLLNTKAGIPFRDIKMDLCDPIILKNREEEQTKSSKISTTQYLKSNR